MVVSESGGSDPVEGEMPRRSAAGAYLALARPTQWTKNVLVLAAPGAAGVLTEVDALAQTAVAFVALCFAASGTYALNDAGDAAADRLHPTKRFRPVASGEISEQAARIAGVAWVLLGIGLGLVVSLELGLVVALYVAVTTAYSMRLKHEPILDILTVAAGFVLRAIAGAAAVDVPPSRWFLIVASFGSLLMVVGKRIAEMDLEHAAAHRPSLDVYSTSFLRQVGGTAATGALLSYYLFAFERADATTATMPWFELTLVPFTYGVLRYLWLMFDGRGGDPTDLVLGDRAMAAAGLVWAGLFVVGVQVG